MKSLEQLRKLADNPFYKMSDEDKQLLKELEKNVSKPQTQESPRRGGPEDEPKTEESTSDDSPKERTTRRKKSSKGNAAVKETGKLNKHSTDPVQE